MDAPNSPSAAPLSFDEIYRMLEGGTLRDLQMMISDFAEQGSKEEVILAVEAGAALSLCTLEAGARYSRLEWARITGERLADSDLRPADGH